MKKSSFLTLAIAATLGLALTTGCSKAPAETSNSSATGTKAEAAEKSKESASAADKSKETPPATDTSNIFTAIDLSKQYKTDKKALDKKYKGKEVTVTGNIWIIISKSGESGMIGLEGVGVSGDVDCRFEEEDQPAFSKLKEGQEVTVKGIFSGQYDSVELQYCKIVAQK